MNIPKSWIDQLIGMSVDKAISIVKADGFNLDVVPDGTIVTLLDVYDTVIIWHKDDIVTSATVSEDIGLYEPGLFMEDKEPCCLCGMG